MFKENKQYYYSEAFMISKKFLSYMVAFFIIICLGGFSYMFFDEPNVFKHQYYPEIMRVEERMGQRVDDANARIGYMEEQLDLMRQMLNQNPKAMAQ